MFLKPATFLRGVFLHVFFLVFLFQNVFCFAAEKNFKEKRFLFSKSELSIFVLLRNVCSSIAVIDLGDLGAVVIGRKDCFQAFLPHRFVQLKVVLTRQVVEPFCKITKDKNR
jgi:hypothetical protein